MKSPVHVDGGSILKIVETICSFGTRWMDSSGAQKTIEYAQSEFEAAGLKVTLQPFVYPHYQPLSASLQVGGRQIACEPVALTPSTIQPLAGELLYGGECTRADLDRLRVHRGGLQGAFVLSDNLRTFVAYPEVEAAGAAGFISITGLPDNTIRCGCARLDGQKGTIPGVAIGGVDGRSIVAALPGGHAEKALIHTQSRTEERTGHNVIARADDQNAHQLIVSAHYDCFWNGVMAMDNCSGTSTVLALSKAFSPQMLAKSAFVLFGAEELGCWGSAAFVDHLTAGTHDLRAVLNLDTFGSDRSGIEVGVTRDLEQTCRRVVQQTGTQVDVWSVPPRAASDQQKFVEKGLPAIWIANGGTDIRYHTDLDTPALMSASHLEKVANLACAFALELLKD